MGVRERYNESNKNKKKKSSTTSGVRDRFEFNSFYSSLPERLKSLSSDASSTYDSYKSRFYDEDENYKNSYRNDTESAYNNFSKTKDKFDSEYEELVGLLEKHKSSLGDDEFEYAKSFLDSTKKNYSDLLETYKSDHDYFSQWKSEEEYKSSIDAQKRYEELKTVDLDVLLKEKTNLEKNVNDLNQTRSTIAKLKAEISNLERAAQRTAVRGEIENQIAAKKTMLARYEEAVAEAEANGYEKRYSDISMQYNQAKHIQNGINLTETAVGADDFDEKSGYVSTKHNPNKGNILERFTQEKYDATYEYINDVDGMREEIKRKHRVYNSDNPWDDGETEYEEKAYDYLTEEEKKVYNWYYEKEGADKATEYLDSIQETLYNRKANERFENLEDKRFAELAFGVYAGLDQFATGMENLFNTSDDYIPVNDVQQASGMVRNDLADTGGNIFGSSIGQAGYDIITTTSNMLPSIIASAATNFVAPGAGAAVGAGLLGASASGNAYQEMLNLGYNKGQARSYSVLVGASEAGLQYLLGGVGKLGGKLSGNVVSKILNGVDNAFARTAIKLGGNMLSEGLEEGLQEMLTPFFQNLVLQADNDWSDIDWSQVAYSGLLGALSAGMLEGGSTIAGEVNTYKTGKEVKNAGEVSNLVKLGKSMSADTVAYQLAGKVNENTGAYTIGRLLHEVGADSLSSTNIAEITSALESRGVAPEHSQTIAKWMNKAVEGGVLSKRQQAALENNEVISSVFKDVVINQNSTVNQRLQGYKDVINTTKYNEAVEESRKFKAKEQKKDNTTSTPVTAESVDTAPIDADVESKFEVAEEGKTIDNTTSDEINIAEIASIKGGEMTLKLDNGETVNAKDVGFATEDEALIYSAVLDMGVNAGVANSIVKNFDSADGVSAKSYALGVKEAYRYGRYNIPVNEMSTKGFSADLTVAQRTHAYKLGQSDARASAEQMQKAIDEAKKNAGTKQVEKGKVHFDGDRTTLTDIQNTSLDTLDKLAESLGVSFYIYESRVENGKRVYTDVDGKVKPAPNGKYYRDGTIHIDLNAGVDGKGTILFTAAHELTHYIKQWSPAKFKVLADFLMEQYGKAGISVDTLVKQQIRKAKANRRTISYDTAYEEVVADSMESMLADGKVAEKLALLKEKDKGLWNKIKQFFKELSAKIREVYKGLDPNSREGRYVAEMKDAIDHIQELFTEALVDASENYSVLANAEVSLDAVAVEDAVMYSYSSLAEAAGFEARETDGIRGYYRNGEKVAKVTVEDIEISPIGAMINYSLDKGDITEEDADRQKKMFADICTMACKTNDFAMTMQFVGSAVFTGMKANADKQYGTTYDFPSICTKTQAVIDAMSAKMVKLKRGLSHEEILDIYQEVFASGNPVPCPECYVFSRWIGIGGLLDNIYEYQTHYGKMSVQEATKAYAELYKKVEAYANENGISFGKAKGALAKKITDTHNKLKEKIEKADNQGEKVKDADRAKLKSLENEMVTVKALSWLGDVYFAENPLDSKGNPKANPKVNKNYAVPVEVLFDLNNGEEFASKYREAWGFRTTQGAGYGKAITPYAEAVLGEGILATNNTTNTIKSKAQGKLNNPFLEQRGMMDKNAKKALDRARMKQKIQAFLGGQRFQSTSDARYENASDYLLAALEMQAMQGRVQVYTKVDGAVPAFSAWGFSINQSLMPLGGGLDAKGNVIDTSVGGMNPKVAFKNRENHETAGTITIGVNDNHIRKMFTDIMRDFIIPYHASGGKAWLVNAFRTVQDRAVKKDTFVRSTDYSRTQSDKVLSDEVLRWKGKTDAEIEQIHAVREARLAILTGGKPNMDVVRGNRFLSALYDKFNGGEWDGVKVAKGKVESQIFPNEFWDQTVTYEQSGKVTQDYLDYCEDLGFLHRFSGMVPSNGILIPVNGYNEFGEKVQLTDLAYKYDENGNKTDEIEPFFWKVLTDRRMYDNSGNYLAQKVVTLNDTAPSTVTNFAKKNDGRQYDALLSKETADKVADSDTLYSLRDVPPVQPSTNKWERTLTTAEVKERFPGLWDVSADESEVRNPTQISGTVKSYRKVYDYLRNEGFDGTILDASSGLGYGTKAGIEEYGFDVEDIEPYPDKSYNPKYTDYSSLDKKYDVIISNAVLNVLPQDQRDALVVKMGEMLNDGGRIFINVRGDDVRNASSKEAINDDLMEYYIAKSGSYQKGFTKTELVSYLEDALGDGFSVAPISFFGKTSAVVTKESGDVLYQDRDSDAVSNRTLLANAMESTINTKTQEGQNELRILNEYKDMVNTLDQWSAELTELRAEIKKESFSKGGNKAKAKQLQEKATKIANRISIYDKRLLTLEATKPMKAVLEREKAKAVKQQKQKDAEVLQAYRDRADAKLKKQAEYYRESREKAVDGRRKTALKQSIKRVVNRLNSLLKNGTKERNVKTGLRDTVASALAAAEILFESNVTNDEIVRKGIDFATEEDSIKLNRYSDLLEQRDSIIGQIDAIVTANGVSGTSDKTKALYAKIDRIDAEIAGLNKELAKVFEMERARINRATVSSAIDGIASAYESIRESEDEYIKNAYDEYVAMRLGALKKSIGGTLIKDMSLAQLTELYNALKSVAHTVANANTMFREGKAEDLAKRVSTVQAQIMSHYKELDKDPSAGAKKPIDFVKDFAWNEMKPVTAFEALGSEAFTELFWDAIEAEGKWAKFMEEAKGFLDKQRETYGYKSWDMESVHEFSLLHGKKFKLTLQDMMSIYAYSKREQAFEHMTSGGFQFSEYSEYKDKDGKKRVHLTGDLYATDMTTISRIVAKLDSLYGGKVTKYVDAVQAYLTDLGSKGNEVSNILYGIDIFNEKAYFPLMSAKDYISSVQEALNNTPTQVSLKNTGMTKQKVPHAKNPIILQGFDSVVEGHIKKMADYCTQVLPIENLRRVFDSVSLGDYGDSVATKNIIKKVFGSSAEKYIDQYITDLNGGTIDSGVKSPTMKMFSRFKGAAVSASLSVIIQQPFAVTRAMALISPKHFIIGKIAKPEGMKLYEEIKKYAPVAIIKEMGGFDVGSGRTAREYLGTRTDKGFNRAVDEIIEKAMWGAQKADELGWGIIWKAVKREVMSQGKFKYGTDEFYEACGKRFTEVIVNTQVYDSVNSRSGYMRAKSDIVKFATAFMGEPTTVVNMAVSAALKLQRATTKAEKKAAGANLMRTTGTLVASTVLTTIFKSFVYAMRDDDDDETLSEKYAKHLVDNLSSDLFMLNLLPYGRDIVSLFEGYNVDRPDMALISNVISSCKKMLKDGATIEEVHAFLGDIANIFGIPEKNLYRDVKAIYNLFSDIFTGNI